MSWLLKKALTKAYESVFVIMTHIVYRITLPLNALFLLFVLWDRIGADSLSLVFSRSNPPWLNLCFAVAESDLGVIRASASLPYKRTKLTGWAELSLAGLMDCSLSITAALLYLEPSSRGLVKKPFLQIFLVHIFFLFPAFLSYVIISG